MCDGNQSAGHLLTDPGETLYVVYCRTSEDAGRTLIASQPNPNATRSLELLNINFEAFLSN